MEQDYRRPFNLERGPAMRVTLFTRSGEDHILLLTIHHIVSDAWSIWLPLGEMRLLYPAVLAWPTPHRYLHGNGITATTFNGRKTLSGPEGDRLWTYWQQQLAGDLPLLDLPTDRPRSAAYSHHGASHFFRFANDLAERLTGLARTEGVTLYMMLLAAFQVLLHRYSGQEDILVGSPTAGRSQPEFAGIVGYFVNPVVMRANLRGNLSFREFLNQVRRVVLGALAHQDFPFPLLVERFNPEARCQPDAALPVSLSFKGLNSPREVADLLARGKADWGRPNLTPFKMPQMEGQFDLTLEIEQGMECVFKYNSALFDAATIERMARHFQTLLEATFATRVRGSQNSRYFPRPSAISCWSVGMTPGRNTGRTGAFTISSRPRSRQLRRRWPVVFGDHRLTYRELDARAGRLAHCLRESRWRPGNPGGRLPSNVRPSWSLVLLAILKAGGGLRASRPLLPSGAPGLPAGGIPGAGGADPDKLQDGHPRHWRPGTALGSDRGRALSTGGRRDSAGPHGVAGKPRRT